MQYLGVFVILQLLVNAVSKDMREFQVIDDDLGERAKWRRKIRKAAPTSICNELLEKKIERESYIFYY